MIKNEIIKKSHPPEVDVDIENDAEDDYAFARNQLKSLIAQSGEAIDQLAVVAEDAEHPRAFEVLSNMIKQNADMNADLLRLLKARKDLHKAERSTAAAQAEQPTSSVTNNTVYIGSTTDLMSMLDEAESAKAIDV